MDSKNVEFQPISYQKWFLFFFFKPFKGDASCETYDEFTPLHTACELGNLEMILFLLTRGASPRHMNRFGNCPMYMAIKNRYIKYTCDYLLIQLIFLTSKMCQLLFHLSLFALSGFLDCSVGVIYFCRPKPRNDLQLPVSSPWSQWVFGYMHEIRYLVNTS